MAGLARDRSKTGEACGLLVIEAGEFGHGGDELIGSQLSNAGDAGQDLLPPGERGIGGDQIGDLGIKGFDMQLDLLELLAALTLEQSDSKIFLAVLECGSIAHQTVPGIDEFSHLGLLHASGRSDWRL